MRALKFDDTGLFLLAGQPPQLSEILNCFSTFRLSVYIDTLEIVSPFKVMPKQVLSHVVSDLVCNLVSSLVELHVLRVLSAVSSFVSGNGVLCPTVSSCGGMSLSFSLFSLAASLCCV